MKSPVGRVLNVGLLALGALVLAGAGCGLGQTGIDPPMDQIFWPAGLAVDPSGNWLYVVNSNNLLTLNQITRAAIRQWKNSNLFMQNIEGEYNRVFSVDDVKIGTVLRIRQPLEEGIAKQIPKWAQHNFA